MDRITACQKKYSQLFHGQPNSGQGNDPELMQILQRLIFGQVSYISALDDKTRGLITCVVLAAYQTLPQLKAHVGAALNAGVEPLELRESIYQCMPWIGCTKTLNALGVVDETLNARGVSLPLPVAATVTEQDRLARGRKIEAALFAGDPPALPAGLPQQTSAALQELLTAYCYGDFYTRAGLDTKPRQLLTLIAVMASGGDTQQLTLHGQACLRLGYTKEDLLAATIHALPYLGVPRTLVIIQILGGKHVITD